MVISSRGRQGGKEKRRGDGGEEEAAHWTGRGWAEQPQSRTSSLLESPQEAFWRRPGGPQEAQGAQEPYTPMENQANQPKSQIDLKGSSHIYIYRFPGGLPPPPRTPPQRRQIIAAPLPGPGAAPGGFAARGAL